jgi:ketosteroid isomerase-like protein
MKLLVLVLSVIAIASAPAQTIPLAPDAAVQKAEAAWGNAIASKSLDGTVAAYDAEGFTAGPAMPPARGIAEVRAMWAKAFGHPNFSFTWMLEKVVVSETGSIATSTGTWRMTGPNGSGPYLAVWRKQRDGGWKILVDSAWFVEKHQ